MSRRAERRHNKFRASQRRQAIKDVYVSQDDRAASTPEQTNPAARSEHKALVPSRSDRKGLKKRSKAERKRIITKRRNLLQTSPATRVRRKLQEDISSQVEDV